MINEHIIEPSSTDKIRFSDCDPFGHLNNSKYFDYMMNARETQLHEVYGFSLEDFYKQGTGWVITSHQIFYLSPAKFNEQVSIGTTLLAYTDSTLKVECVMSSQASSKIKAVLWTELACVNLATGKKQAHPREVFAFAEKVLNKRVDPSEGIAKRIQFLTQKPIES